MKTRIVTHTIAILIALLLVGLVALVWLEINRYQAVLDQQGEINQRQDQLLRRLIPKP